MQLAPPFSGPVWVDPYGRPLPPASNPLSLAWKLGLTTVALAAVGTAAVYFGLRVKHHGRLICRTDNHTLGVPSDYNGDWWEDRGRRLYYQARRDGYTSAEQISEAIIRSEITGGPYKAGTGADACMAQFPPHSETHPSNVEFWQGIMQRVLTEMGEEPGEEPKQSSFDVGSVSVQTIPGTIPTHPVATVGQL